MRFLAKLILAILVNAAALVAIAYWLPNVTLANDAVEIFSVAITLTALNFFLKPILRMILGPFIVLTLGIGLLAVNAAILFLLDFLFASFSIHGISALMLMTICVSVVNFVYHLATKSS